MSLRLFLGFHFCLTLVCVACCIQLMRPVSPRAPIPPQPFVADSGLRSLLGISSMRVEYAASDQEQAVAFLALRFEGGKFAGKGMRFLAGFETDTPRIGRAEYFWGKTEGEWICGFHCENSFSKSSDPFGKNLHGSSYGSAPYRAAFRGAKVVGQIVSNTNSRGESVGLSVDPDFESVVDHHKFVVLIVAKGFGTSEEAFKWLNESDFREGPPGKWLKG